MFFLVELVFYQSGCAQVLHFSVQEFHVAENKILRTYIINFLAHDQAKAQVCADGCRSCVCF